MINYYDINKYLYAINEYLQEIDFDDLISFFEPATTIEESKENTAKYCADDTLEKSFDQINHELIEYLNKLNPQTNDEKEIIDDLRKTLSQLCSTKTEINDTESKLKSESKSEISNDITPNCNNVTSVLCGCGIQPTIGHIFPIFAPFDCYVVKQTCKKPQENKPMVRQQIPNRPNFTYLRRCDNIVLSIPNNVRRKYHTDASSKNDKYHYVATKISNNTKVIVSGLNVIDGIPINEDEVLLKILSSSYCVQYKLCPKEWLYLDSTN